MKKQSMAATFVSITKDEFDKFLKTRYRVYQPKVVDMRGEAVYDLSLTDDIAVRIYSSISYKGVGAEVGQDAIRVLLFGTKINRPINKKAGSSIVKRTQGWRNSLSDRIDSFIEEYHEKQDFYDRIATGQKQELTGLPVEDVAVGQEQKDFDASGNFTPTPETKAKYVAKMEDLIFKVQRFSPGYADFLVSVKKQLINNGRLSPKQKDSVDTALTKNKIL